MSSVSLQYRPGLIDAATTTTTATATQFHYFTTETVHTLWEGGKILKKDNGMWFASVWPGSARYVS